MVIVGCLYIYIIMSAVRQIDPTLLTMAALQQALRATANYAKSWLLEFDNKNTIISVVAICFEDDDAKRNLFLAASELNMTTADFVYVILEYRGLGFSESCSSASISLLVVDRPISMNSTDWVSVR